MGYLISYGRNINGKVLGENTIEAPTQDAADSKRWFAENTDSRCGYIITSISKVN